MNTSRTEIQKELQNDMLKCPAEFNKHLSKFGYIDRILEYRINDERQNAEDIIKEIRDDYRDYCHDTGLDVNADNRDQRPGFFMEKNRRT